MITNEIQRKTEIQYVAEYPIYDEYMNIFSVVFQDFQLICQSLGANVAGSMDYDRDRVQKALIDAGFDDRLAALDPVAEAEIYSRFNDIAGDKTAIYISHRLSSCKFCDEIAVFHEGAVIQQGTHVSLVADENGKYYELWHAQAQYYTE